jgi:hypothetical protein
MTPRKIFGALWMLAGLSVAAFGGLDVLLTWVRIPGSQGLDYGIGSSSVWLGTRDIWTVFGVLVVALGLATMGLGRALWLGRRTVAA